MMRLGANHLVIRVLDNIMEYKPYFDKRGIARCGGIECPHYDTHVPYGQNKCNCKLVNDQIEYGEVCIQWVIQLIKKSGSAGVTC
jgi:hypothetical protein